MEGNLYPELFRLLRGAGCSFVKQGKGSHEIWFSPSTNRNATVPRNPTMVRTTDGILKDAGLPQRF